MFHAVALTNLIKLYYLIRTMHGVYVSYQFLTWIILTMYGTLSWILYYIPKPLHAIEYKEMYYDITHEDGDYIEILKFE
jgi:hypothetical protein